MYKSVPSFSNGNNYQIKNINRVVGSSRYV